MYVPIQVNRSQKKIYLSSSTNMKKHVLEIFILQNLILRTRSYTTDFINQSCWPFHFRQTTVSIGNILYHSCTTIEEVCRGGQPLNIFT